MCGRYSLTTPPQIVAQIFRAAMPSQDWPPRYNIAPTQCVPVIRQRASRGDEPPSARTLDLLRWGLVPFWSKDPGSGGRGGAAAGGMINAKSETAAEKPAFRHAFQRQRCLVPADSFFEWKTLDARTKQPYLIRRRDRQPFAFAGIWDRWRSRERAQDSVIESFTILTTDPNDLVRDVHDRMPVIIHPDDYDRWLDPRIEDPAQLKPLLAPLPAEHMEMHPVSRRVNKPEHDDPSCIAPVEPVQPRAHVNETPNLFQ